MGIHYLHTMVRVKDLTASMAFYELFGLRETRRHENEKGALHADLHGASRTGGMPGRTDL
jgi:catechol 2,3-dioxygenase-like lactoylglutathione lyase family enzyme